MAMKKEFSSDAGFFIGISPADRCDLESAWRAAQGSGKTLTECVKLNARLNAADQLDLQSASQAARDAGVTLTECVKFFLAHRKMDCSLSLDDAIMRFLREREKQKVSKRTAMSLRGNLERFSRGREQKALAAISRNDLIEYLEAYSGSTYNSYLTSLRTFFKWAVQSEILGSSPADKVVKIKSRNLQDDDLEPAILSVDQCRRLLKSAIQVDPGMVAYIAACLFGGLRPEREAAGLSWRDVGDQVLVMAKNAKSRQRRWVSNPLLMEWLAFGAIACAGALPVVGCRSRMERVRKDAGLLTGWGHDCMRHTFASMFMATHGAEKTIAQLGHGNYDMLFRHYRALVPEAIAKEFWSMRPSTLIPKSAKA